VTSGDDIASLAAVAHDGHYSAGDVIEWLQAPVRA
jgi:hypothetical protein